MLQTVLLDVVCTESGAQLNMRAVYLHVLGDALGSVVVIISGILIKFIDADWKYKIDPVLRYVKSPAIFYLQDRCQGNCMPIFNLPRSSFSGNTLHQSTWIWRYVV